MIVPSVTTVSPLTRIRKERWLPRPGELVVNVGQQVTPVQVIARTSEERGFTVVPAAQILGVPAHEVSQYLLVEEGAAVQKQKPLLRKRGLFGGKSFSSPVNGILYQISNGRLILQQTPDLVELRAMLQGVVAGFLGNRGVIVETNGALIQGAWGSGREGFGSITVMSENGAAPLLTEHVGADARGTVLVGGYLDTLNVLKAAEENSVRGVIVGSVPAGLLSSLPAFRFPIIVTEGFRGQSMAPPIFELLQQSQGKEASLFGAAAESGERPEIIIPLPASEAAQPSNGSLQPVAEGQRVRIWRAPFAGAVGEVVALHTRSRVTDLGFRVPGVDVALANGQVIFVPYPNLDMIR